MSDFLIVDLQDDISRPKGKLTRADLWFYGRENEDFIYYERRVRLPFHSFKAKLLLEGLFKPVTVLTATSFVFKHGTRARGSFNSLVGCVETLKDLWKGILTVHGACVEKGGEAILLPALPCTGKTLATLQFLNLGYRYLADDTVKVDGEGVAHVNLGQASAVGTYILPYVDKMSLLGRFGLQLREKLRGFAGGTKVVSPYMLKAWQMVEGAEVCERAKVTKVCVMEKGPRKIELLPLSKFVDKIMAINNYSLPQFSHNPVLTAYSFFNPNLDFSALETTTRIMLTRTFMDTDKYLVSCNDGKWVELINQI